jgi:hypothetical protein
VNTKNLSNSKKIALKFRNQIGKLISNPKIKAGM